MEQLPKKESKRREYARTYELKHKEQRRKTRQIWYKNNKETLLESGRRYRKEHPEVHIAYRARNLSRIRRVERNGRLKRHYGLTQTAFENLLREQDNKCVICAKELKSPRVDHNHETGKVRGILCLQCNTGLGSFRDSPKLLDKASRYVRLRKYGTISKKGKNNESENNIPSSDPESVGC